MIYIIGAMSRNRVVGKEGKIPWKVAEELSLFRKITYGNVVVMGRKTFDAIGGLEGRRNIVLSGSRMAEGVERYGNLEEALSKAETSGKRVFVIGGGETFSEALPFASFIYLSVIGVECEGDSFFPELDERQWHRVGRRAFERFVFLVYERNGYSHSIVEGGLSVIS